MARGALIALALGLVVLHIATGGQYGFHRDELATLDDARHLAWGYVAYPPVTPLFGRASLELFGQSVAGARFFPALAQALVAIVAGLMAHQLGGSRRVQLMAATAVAFSPVALGSGALLQYVAFDFLWWVLAAYFVMRLLRTDDPRWWVAIGAAIGLGMLTKYTMGFLALGIAGATVLTEARRHLRSPWLWGGAVLAVAIFLPNLMWQASHDFITLDFLRGIHARDIRIGRTSGFYQDQLLMNLFTLPLWVAGLVYYFRRPQGRRFRFLGWLFVITFGLFAVAQGRGYYTAPAYPMLIAAGAVAIGERFRRTLWPIIAIGGLLSAAIVLPVAPVNSTWWQLAVKANNDLREEIGWPELVETVAGIARQLPPADRARFGILAGNYGEAGALNMFGPAYGLPAAFSGVNSYWLRGYPDPPPDTLIVVGLGREFLEQNFEVCELAGTVTNRFGVANEETTGHRDVFVCRRLKGPWSGFWRRLQRFG